MQYAVIACSEILVPKFRLENVSVFELQSIRIIDCNSAIQLIESKYLKMTKVIQII